jgi:integrase
MGNELMKRSDDEIFPTGITPTYWENGDRRGFRVTVWMPQWPGYPKGRLLQKRFPATATITAMRDWQEEQRVDGRRRVNAGTPPPVAVGFAANADAYLATRASSPTFAERRRYVLMWVELFGERDHTTITAAEIRAQCEQWILHGPKWIYDKGKRVLKPLPLSPQEVNLRLRVLENIWTTLWPTERNIVRDVQEYGDATTAKPRGQTFALAYEVRDYMPDLSTPPKNGAAEIGSLSRVRFEVMFLTGLEPQQVGRLAVSDVDFSVPSIVLPLRQKGFSTKRRKRPRRRIRARPLLDEAVPAFRRLFALGGNRPFSHASLGRSIKRAVAAANRQRKADGKPLIDTTLRLKDWTRHTCGSEIYRRTGDLKMVQELLGLSDLRMAEIYAESAVQEHMKTAAAKLNDAVRHARLRAL